MSEITDGPALGGRTTDVGGCLGSVDEVRGGECFGATAPAAVAIPSLRRQTATTGLRR
jgi:hypothetical protein